MEIWLETILQANSLYFRYKLPTFLPIILSVIIQINTHNKKLTDLIKSISFFLIIELLLKNQNFNSSNIVKLTCKIIPIRLFLEV